MCHHKHGLLAWGGRDVRTSQGTFMTRMDDPDGVLAWIEEKAAQVTGIPVSHGEVSTPENSSAKPCLGVWRRLRR